MYDDIMIFNPTRKLSFDTGDEEPEISSSDPVIDWNSFCTTKRDSVTARLRRAVSAIARSGLEVSGHCAESDVRTILSITYSSQELDTVIRELKKLNRWIIFSDDLSVRFPGDISAADLVRDITG